MTKPTRETAGFRQSRGGARVKVRESDPMLELRGLFGTITQSYGSPDYAAYEVLLDNGRLELFWHHQLEEAPKQTG
jgi:hypothetical protein